jgi:hypothetical protein
MCGIPHLQKGEFTQGAGPATNAYSIREPLGVVAGISPFNFPAMIPLWMLAPAIAAGNAFIWSRGSAPQKLDEHHLSEGKEGLLWDSIVIDDPVRPSAFAVSLIVPALWVVLRTARPRPLNRRNVSSA